ncbi:MAG: sigma-70 family RNA polymerase sigma factor [Candidatus Kapabacteria bacterium]|nr:sigma-70 family RNA polymerase sigma factor [Candidatus Kapabacteria bacterium]
MYAWRATALGISVVECRWLGTYGNLDRHRDRLWRLCRCGTHGLSHGSVAPRHHLKVKPFAAAHRLSGRVQLAPWKPTVSSLALNLQTDADILEAFREGSREQASTAFVRRHQRFVYSVAVRQLGSTEDARDAAQDVFVKALQAIDTFKGDSTLQTWLYRITANVCTSMRRRQRWLSFFAIGEGAEERDVVADQPSTAQATYDAEFEAFFEKVLSGLPEKQRETFCLRYYDELTYEEISQIMQCALGTAKANYHWAVKKIAEALRPTEYYKRWMQHDDQP